MLKSKFGIEIEFTGITRSKAANVLREYFGGKLNKVGGYYDKYELKTNDGRTWSVMKDGSILCEKKTNGYPQYANGTYSVELVSPILTYENDIADLQEIIRKLRKAGAFTNDT